MRHGALGNNCGPVRRRVASQFASHKASGNQAGTLTTSSDGRQVACTASSRTYGTWPMQAESMREDVGRVAEVLSAVGRQQPVSMQRGGLGGRTNVTARPPMERWGQQPEPSTSSSSVAVETRVYADDVELKSRGGKGTAMLEASHGIRSRRFQGAHGDGRRLSAQIQSCSNWFQLRAVLSTSSRDKLNMLHATASMSRLAAIVRYPMQVRGTKLGAPFV